MKTIAEIQAVICELDEGDFAELLGWMLKKEDADIRSALAEADADIARGDRFANI